MQGIPFLYIFFFSHLLVPKSPYHTEEGGTEMTKGACVTMPRLEQQF